MNSERMLYIRSLLMNQPGIHRVGLILITKIDSTVYITASLCNKADRFNKQAAIGLCRKRRANAVKAFHLQMNSPTALQFVTVDKTNFLRSVNDDTSIDTILKNLGIKAVIERSYAVDKSDLEDIVHHEIDQLQDEQTQNV